MKKLVQLLLLMTVPLAVMASELKEGTLTVLLFSEGKPLAANEVKIDGRKVYKTDEDGAVKVRLPGGRHQIEIFGKNPAGQNLGYFKKRVSIKEGRDTEIIATLSKKGADSIDIDTPVAVAKSVEREEEKATGEGRLTGKVLSSEGNTPIAGARVFVRGTAVDVRTDESGRFSAKVPSGKTLSISVVHSAYSAQTIGGIVVKKDGTTSRTVKLTPASMELEEFVVLAPKIEGSIADVMAEEKQINAIANILGSAELSKKGDSDAAAALKRVTGVTLVDGKSIYVRGLGDRYSNIEMNSLPLASPDPTKRSVPLDIFPASVIGSMKVQKSATADIPSSFGGGYIDIRTRDVSKESFIKLSASIKGNSNTGKDSHNYGGSSTDWYGFDDGYRAVWQAILDAAEVKVGERVPSFTTNDYTEEQLIAFTQGYVDRDYNIETRKLPIGFGGSIEGAHYWELDDENLISVYGNYGYSQKHNYVKENFYAYDMTIDGELQEDASRYGTNEKSVSEYAHGGMLNIGYNFSDVFTAKYTKLYTRTAQDSTRIVDGIIGSNYDHLIKYFLEWEERVMNVDQVTGEFDYQLFNSKSTAEFGLERATAKLYQPNNYQYSYIEESGNVHVDHQISNHLAQRLESDDELYAMYLNNKTEIDLLSDEDYIKMGLKLSTKDRVSRQNKFFMRQMGASGVDDSEMTGDIESIYYEYVRADIPYDERALLVSPLFTPADYFDATVDEMNLFANIFIKPYENLEVMAGLRYVDFAQTVYQYMEDRENPDISLRRLIQRVPESLEIQNIYPSISAKYEIDEKNQLDMAFSSTYIAPDLREFTSGEYFHPYDVATVVGNPDLVNTDIYSLDFKYSYFFSDTESIKVGTFFKYLDKPIEDVMMISSSLPIYSYDNADSAILYGLELDGRKELSFLSNYLMNYFVSGNFSYTESEVTLRDEQLSTFTTNYRQLQGLSPFVVNLTFSYEEDDRNVALSYNKMDERIRKVGLVDGSYKYPDNYEVPPHLLDLVWIEKYKDYTFKFKAGNLLNDEIIWKQGDRITKEFQTGTTFDFSASYKY
jgi:hypothetical protein